jgi:hypothetical protein
VVDADEASVVAFLRHDRETGRSALVVANLADEPVGPVSLELAEGPLCSVSRVDVVYGTATTATPPSIDHGGGFDGYMPVDGLGPRQLVVVGLDR